MIEVKVQNIVASTTFAEKLDLDVIAQSLEDAEYEPEQFGHNGGHDPQITEYTYEIPWDTDWDNKNLYIAAHAVVWVWGICP